MDKDFDAEIEKMWRLKGYKNFSQYIEHIAKIGFSIDNDLKTSQEVKSEIRQIKGLESRESSIKKNDPVLDAWLKKQRGEINGND